MSHDDDIVLDFSKIKGLFKRSEKDKVKELEQKAEYEKKEMPEAAEKIDKIEEDLKKEEKEAAIIDAEEKMIDKKLEQQKHELQDIKDSSEKDEEININFSGMKSKIKGMFQKDGSDKDEEISFNIEKTKDFYNKHSKKIIPAVLLIIALFASIFLRVMPAYLPITDDWAENTINNQLRADISSKINSQYPNLPQANKDSLIASEIEKVKETQKTQLEEQKTQVSQYFKTRLQDDNGQTYLVAIDPYFWMRFARNIIEKGMPGDEIKDGVQWDNHMYAPTGRPIDKSMMHSYIMANLYKFSNMFNKNTDLMSVAFFMPIWIMALAIIPAFFIGRKVGGNVGGFVAGLMVAIHPAILSRTIGGFADTDAYNIMFPLFVTWLFLEALDQKDIKKALIFSSISGLLLGIYSNIWIGWWYIIGFLIAASAIYIGYYLLLHRGHLLSKNKLQILKEENIRIIGMVILFFLISSGIFVSLFSGFDVFLGILKGPLAFAKMKEVGIDSVWPNVFTTVAEQNTASLDGVINQLSFGRWYILLLGLFGLVLMMTKTKMQPRDYAFLGISLLWYIIITVLKLPSLITFLVLVSIPVIARLIMGILENETSTRIKTAIIFTIWITATIYASTKGVRYTLILVPAFSVAFGASVGILYRYLSQLISKGLDINKYVTQGILLTAIAVLLIVPVVVGYNSAKQEIPSMNDAWYNSLDKIKQESEPDAIINSWWDFGHWFKAIGDRGVTFDGTSQNSPQAHWIGNTLLTSDEDTAIGILRMLDCSGYSGGTYAFTDLMDIIKDHPKTIDILYEIIVQDKDTARTTLTSKYGLTQEQADKILSSTHCDPPEDYFIVSDDMIGKSGVWGHFGAWNFDRALMYNTLKKKEYQNDIQKSTAFLQQRFNMTEEDAVNTFHEIQSLDSDAANTWIAPWPSYLQGLTGCTNINNVTHTCQFIQGTLLEVNIEDEEASLTSNNQVIHPKRLIIATDKGIKTKEYESNVAADIGITLVPTGKDTYASLLAAPDTAESMFTRLFFMDGYGLSHFKKFSDERSVTGGRIIVYKVDWQGGDPNNFAFFEKTGDEPEQASDISGSNETTE